MDVQTLKNSLCNVKQCESDMYVLEEKDKSASLRRVTMCDIPIGSLVIRMDNKVHFNNFLKDKWGFNKHSDYLIVTEDKLVFVELKSRTEISNKLQDECLSKFKSDNCTLTYADKIFQELLSKNSFFESREPHYVLLYQAPSIMKVPTTMTLASQPNATPSTFRAIPVLNEGTISFYRTI